MRRIAEHPPGFDPAAPWTDLGEPLRRRTRIFEELQVQRRSPHTTREHTYVKLACPEWVNVIAFTSDLELLIVEQFRHGIDEPTLEIPGGVCDAGEAPEAAAHRELLEETGHHSDAWHALGACLPNPAIQTNRCHFYLALDARPLRALDLDPSEEIRLWAFRWSEWEAKLRSAEVQHALVLTAFFRLGQWPGWPALERRLAAS